MEEPEARTEVKFKTVALFKEFEAEVIWLDSEAEALWEIEWVPIDAVVITRVDENASVIEELELVEVMTEIELDSSVEETPMEVGEAEASNVVVLDPETIELASLEAEDETVVEPSLNTVMLALDSTEVLPENKLELEIEVVTEGFIETEISLGLEEGVLSSLEILLEVSEVYVLLVTESVFEAEKALDTSELDSETWVAVTDDIETADIISVEATEVIEVSVEETLSSAGSEIDVVRVALTWVDWEASEELERELVETRDSREPEVMVDWKELVGRESEELVSVEKDPVEVEVSDSELRELVTKVFVVEAKSVDTEAKPVELKLSVRNKLSDDEAGKVLELIRLVEYEDSEEVDESGSNKDVAKTVLVGDTELVLVK